MPGRLKKRDPMELQIELALSPGIFIRDRACYSFVSRLEGVAAEMEALINQRRRASRRALRDLSRWPPRVRRRNSMIREAASP
jgi:hypothetical protein